MAASAQGSASTSKAVASDSKDDTKDAVQKPAAALEEDDEFEDFPVEGASRTSFPNLSVHLVARDIRARLT